MTFTKFWRLLQKAATAWNNDNTLTLGAALAYYAVFSISPLLVIALYITGYFFKEDSTTYIQTEIGNLVGRNAAEVITGTISLVNQSRHGAAATFISLIVLFVGASGVFVQLQDSLNRIWGVSPKPGQFVRDLLKQRLASFAMVVGVGFLLLVSLLLSAALAAITGYFDYLLPSANFVWYGLDITLSFATVVLVFAAVYKVVPDVRLEWKDVWAGAFLGAVLFVVGKSLIAFYLGRSGVGSAFGAAGSILVILAWVYYSSQILFFGAEFTKIYTEQHGQKVKPLKGVEAVTERMLKLEEKRVELGGARSTAKYGKKNSE